MLTPSHPLNKPHGMAASMSVSSPEHVVPLSICYLLLLLQLRGAQCHGMTKDEHTVSVEMRSEIRSACMTQSYSTAVRMKQNTEYAAEMLVLIQTNLTPTHA